MPACFLLEGLAQTGGILVGEANDFQENVVLAKINSARFVREALAGETVVYDTRLVHLRTEGASIAGTVGVVPPGTPLDAPTPEVLGTAEIFFAHLDPARSRQMFGERNFVFSGELKHMLGLAKAVAQRTDRATESP
jgi:3-hydroxyacyl-[acyl-carrier-protein] dehydratase